MDFHEAENLGQKIIDINNYVMLKKQITLDDIKTMLIPLLTDVYKKYEKQCMDAIILRDKDKKYLYSIQSLSISYLKIKMESVNKKYIIEPHSNLTAGINAQNLTDIIIIVAIEDFNKDKDIPDISEEFIFMEMVGDPDIIYQHNEGSNIYVKFKDLNDWNTNFAPAHRYLEKKLEPWLKDVITFLNQEFNKYKLINVYNAFKMIIFEMASNF